MSPEQTRLEPPRIVCDLSVENGSCDTWSIEGNPDRKGKVESGVGHAHATPLKGLRFETLEQAHAYLDRWETRWLPRLIPGPGLDGCSASPPDAHLQLMPSVSRDIARHVADQVPLSELSQDSGEGAGQIAG